LAWPFAVDEPLKQRREDLDQSGGLGLGQGGQADHLPQLRSLTPILGRRNELTSEKARRVLGFSPRPATTTVVECAESLLRGNMA
jgi:hypothetical protein